jgi:hypothetical protein
MWTVGPSGLAGSTDLPWLTAVLGLMRDGGMGGRLDLSRLVFRGWSGGAHMVSWLIQVLADDRAALGAGVEMRGAVMFSGGSYACYSDPWNADVPVGGCVGCIQGSAKMHPWEDALAGYCDPVPVAPGRPRCPRAHARPSVPR